MIPIASVLPSAASPKGSPKPQSSRFLKENKIGRRAHCSAGGKSTSPVLIAFSERMLSHQPLLIEKLKKPGPSKAYGWNTRKTTMLTIAARPIFPIILRREGSFPSSSCLKYRTPSTSGSSSASETALILEAVAIPSAAPKARYGQISFQIRMTLPLSSSAERGFLMRISAAISTVSMAKVLVKESTVI